MIALLALLLALSPWNGKDLPTATASAAKYGLSLKGTPGTLVHLQATNVATGWIAAFCNERVCSPEQVTQTISASGKSVIQFELIREDDKAPHKSGATITSDDGTSLIVAPVSR